MNCFNHPDRPAVGLCKSCCKGLCADCAATLPNGLACRSACEERVTLINRIVDNNEKIIASANTQIRSSGLLILLIGAALCVGAFLMYLRSGEVEDLIVGVPGIVFVAYGVIRLMRRSQLFPAAR